MIAGAQDLKEGETYSWEGQFELPPKQPTGAVHLFGCNLSAGEECLAGHIDLVVDLVGTGLH